MQKVLDCSSWRQELFNLCRKALDDPESPAETVRLAWSLANFLHMTEERDTDEEAG